MGEFEVRPEALSQTGSQTNEVADLLRELLHLLRPEESPAGVDLMVDRALSGMLGDFHEGMSAMASFVGEHGAAIKRAGDGYRATEDGNTDAFRNTGK